MRQISCFPCLKPLSTTANVTNLGKMSKNNSYSPCLKNEAAADDAGEGNQKWDKDNHDVKLRAIGVLVKNDKGKIKPTSWVRGEQGWCCPFALPLC